MFKNCVILLLLSASNHLILVLSASNLMNSRNSSGFNVLNEVLIFLLEECKFEVRNMVVYDDSSGLSTFEAVSLLQRPTSVSFMSSWALLENREIYSEIVLVDVLVLILDFDKSFQGIDSGLVKMWPYKKNCTIFVLAKQYFQCSNALNVLLSLRRFSLPAFYYICSYERRDIVTLTLKPYKDTKSPFWRLDHSLVSEGQNWSMYYRLLYKDSTKTCKEFQFQRQHSRNVVYITLGITSTYIKGGIELKKNFYYDEQLEPYIDPELLILINQLKTLLKVNFLYYILWVTNSLDFTYDTYNFSQVDMIIFYEFLITTEFPWFFFHPIIYDDYVILSYNRGLKTPLEKIASFYGLWTLISLLLLSILVFIVIWFKTNKNINLAFFDVLRLLIDSGVNVPIDRLSLKVFFSMIFIYFLVIHATFSGHLAKFLTESKFKENIESLEDLLDPQIKIIYSHGFMYGNIDSLEILNNKTIFIKVRNMCPVLVERTPNSVCISQASNLRSFRAARRDWNNTFYVSKTKLRSSASAYVYRPGFSLKEKMNWAIMSLLETKTFDRGAVQTLMDDSFTLEKQTKLSDIDFRLITMNDLKFAFMLLAIGNSFGLIAFLSELYIDWHRRKNKTENRHNIPEPIKKNTHLKITVRQKKLHPLSAVHQKFSKSFKPCDSL